MSARRRDHLTADLFAAAIPRPIPAHPASMDFRPQVAHLVGEMLDAARHRDPRLDRYGVAAEVSRLVGKEVSKSMLDGYTAESREAFNIPFYLVPALETACNSTALSQWLASVRGGRLVLGPEAIDAEIGRLEGEREAISEHLRELRDLRRRVR